MLRRNRMVLIVGSLAAALAVLSLGVVAQPPERPAQAVAWEYASFHRAAYAPEGLEVQMNERGAQGWEFVGAHQSTLLQDGAPSPVTVYVFKRQKGVARN